MKEREEFRLLRLRKRIKIREIAALLSCHKSHVSNYENNRTSMTNEKVRLYQQYILEKRVEEK